MPTLKTHSTSLRANPDTIVAEQCCIDCGYSLKGLRIGGNCPECGRPIKSRKRAPRYTDQLVHAPMGWLEVFAVGSLLLLFSAAGTLGLTVTILFVSNVPILLTLAGVCAMWTVGVFVCTRPRPVMPTTTVNVNEEWRGLRIAARTTQCFWPLTALLVLLAIWVHGASVSTAALYSTIAAAGLSLLVGIAGLAPTCVLLAKLADWAEDSSLADCFRACAWTICFCGLVIALFAFHAYTGLLGGLIGGLLATFIIAMVFMPPGFFLYCLFRLQSMARWAVWNHVAAEAKLDRFRARAESAQRAPRSASPRHAPPRQR